MFCFAFCGLLIFLLYFDRC